MPRRTRCGRWGFRLPRGAPRVRCNICNTHCVYRSTLSNIRADARSMVTTGPHADQRGALSVRTRSRDGRRRHDHRCRLSR
ncbi:hypothetical protein ACFZB0_01205 [Streptomyces rubiginosohelvolus]|uniref:zinc finger domain-containing protein n=1 Tax=Streptomyces rubiginosohelvolus TaxID=67362 RepID=UPI0036E08220